MIAYVSGTLAEKKPTQVVIDVQGVGYSLQIPTSTFEKLPAEGQPVSSLRISMCERMRFSCLGLAPALSAPYLRRLSEYRELVPS